MQSRRFPLSALTVAVLVCTLFPTLSAAQPITLEQLIGGEDLLVGDKLFSDWQLVDNRSKAASDPLTTIVEGFVTNEGLVGLSFNGVANDSLVATGNEIIDFTFRFTVRSLNDLAPLTDIGLSLANFDSHDILDISEFAFEQGGSPFFDSFAFNSVNPGKTSDVDVFAPRETIEVEKTIVLGGGFAFDENGDPVFDEDGNPVGVTSSITEMQQTFSQVPEPTTVALVGLGALTLLACWHRAGRRQSRSRAMKESRRLC